MKLENAGYKAVHVNSFGKNEDELKIIPDLIIEFSDMKKMKGFDKLKASFAENKTPIICTGTKSDFETQEVCKELNIIGVFMKPFNSRDLIEFTNTYFVAIKV